MGPDECDDVGGPAADVRELVQDAANLHLHVGAVLLRIRLLDVRIEREHDAVAADGHRCVDRKLRELRHGGVRILEGRIWKVAAATGNRHVERQGGRSVVGGHG